MTLIFKYLIIYAYLLLVMGVSFAISKRFRNNEISRNIVHICAGLGWILYRLFFPATIHPVIISFSFVLLTVITIKLKISFIERENRSLGTVFFTVSMFIMSLIGYKSPILFDIFGIAITCLSCGDAAANIIGSRFGTKKIYKEKSIQGTIACFGISVITIIMLRYLFNIEISFAAICLLAVFCSITELFAGEYDNIAVPAVLYMTTYIILTNTNILNLLLSLAIGVFMLEFTMKLRLLNVSASCMLFFFIFVLFYFGGIKVFATLMLIFSVVIVVEKCLHKKTDSIFQSINKENGVRNEKQLIANCLIAIIAVVVYGITKNEVYIVTFFAAIAETIGDSVASDIGVLSKTEPIDICSFKKVPKGISGGVSIIGTITSLIVCLYAGLVYFFIYEIDFYRMFVIFITSFSGIILDSILGSKIQVQYRCVVCKKITERECHCKKPTELVKGYKFFDNTRINILCNMFSSSMACLLMAMR